MTRRWLGLIEMIALVSGSLVEMPLPFTKFLFGGNHRIQRIRGGGGKAAAKIRQTTGNRNRNRRRFWSPCCTRRIRVAKRIGGVWLRRRWSRSSSFRSSRIGLSKRMSWKTRMVSTARKRSMALRLRESVVCQSLLLHLLHVHGIKLHQIPPRKASGARGSGKMAPHKPMGAGLELGKLLVLRCGKLLLKEKVMMSRARLRLK